MVEHDVRTADGRILRVLERGDPNGRVAAVGVLASVAPWGADESLGSGLGPGPDGWWDDDLAMLEPWGFDFESIAGPVLLLHGRQDRFVPFGHGEWLARRIPGVEAWLTDEDGHLSLTERHLASVHDWLLERLG